MLQTPSTIIVLRHDSSVRWEQSEVVLHKGELGLAYLDDGRVIIKAGDGSNTWSNLPTINAALESKIQSLTDDLVIANTNIITNSTNIAAALDIANANKNSINTLTSSVASIQTVTDSHENKLAGITTTVVRTIDDALKALVLPKSSEEITVEEDGALTINSVSTDKLVQGEEVLVLDGGSVV